MPHFATSRRASGRTGRPIVLNSAQKLNLKLLRKLEGSSLGGIEYYMQRATAAVNADAAHSAQTLLILYLGLASGLCALLPSGGYGFYNIGSILFTLDGSGYTSFLDFVGELIGHTGDRKRLTYKAKRIFGLVGLSPLDGCPSNGTPIETSMRNGGRYVHRYIDYTNNRDLTTCYKK